MAKLTLKDISDQLRKLDICMMTTKSSDGMLESRPMSNNKDVDYDGESYFFTLDTMSAVKDIQTSPEVCLVYEGRSHLLTSHIYICVSGSAELIQDKAEFKKHWVKDLDAWFKQGVDTPGLTLIKAKAKHIKYWDGMEQGEVSLPANPMRKAS